MAARQVELYKDVQSHFERVDGKEKCVQKKRTVRRIPKPKQTKKTISTVDGDRTVIDVETKGELVEEAWQNYQQIKKKMKLSHDCAQRYTDEIQEVERDIEGMIGNACLKVETHTGSEEFEMIPTGERFSERHCEEIPGRGKEELEKWARNYGRVSKRRLQRVLVQGRLQLLWNFIQDVVLLVAMHKCPGCNFATTGATSREWVDAVASGMEYSLLTTENFAGIL